MLTPVQLAYWFFNLVGLIVLTKVGGMFSKTRASQISEDFHGN